MSRTSQTEAVKSKVESVTFKNLDVNPNQTYHGVDSNGKSYSISIARVDNQKNTFHTDSVNSTQSWKIWYTNGPPINVGYYIDVSNNRIINQYDHYIYTALGVSYSNVSLSYSDYSSIMNFTLAVSILYPGWQVFQGDCFLKADCTGNNNEVAVSHQV
ncbi:MAG: DUF5626 family protein [bacterium]